MMNLAEHLIMSTNTADASVAGNELLSCPLPQWPQSCVTVVDSFTLRLLCAALRGPADTVTVQAPSHTSPNLALHPRWNIQYVHNDLKLEHRAAGLSLTHPHG